MIPETIFVKQCKNVKKSFIRFHNLRMIFLITNGLVEIYYVYVVAEMKQSNPHKLQHRTVRSLSVFRCFTFLPWIPGVMEQTLPMERSQLPDFVPRELCAFSWSSVRVMEYCHSLSLLNWKPNGRDRLSLFLVLWRWILFLVFTVRQRQVVRHFDAAILSNGP